MRFLNPLVALCALVLVAADARAADKHPPIGTVVTASDNGLPMIHVGGGHFVEVAPGAAPKAAPACVCADSCACPAGSCPAQCPAASAPKALPFALPQSGCPNGRCPAPTVQPRRRLFGG